MTQWNQMLRSLGLTDSESTIYLLSLEMGPSPVQDIARRANVSRMTTYTAIESLTGHGLMSSVQKGKKTLYAAEAPERIIGVIHSKIQEIQNTLREAEGSLVELKLKQHGEKPIVKLFEGKEALNAIQDDITSSAPSSIDEFGNIDEINKLYPHEDRSEFYKKIEKLEYKDRAILVTNKQLKDRSARPDSIVVHLDPEKYKCYGDVFVYGNKVALSTFRGKQISVLIESQELADTFRAFFDFALNKQ